MDAILLEWGSLLLRWLHVIAGIAWIGSSFYFMHIDAALKPVPDIPAGKGGEVWEVHGGGFYQVRKWLVAPEKLPPELIWHKWEAYATWVSGFFLLVWIYYLGADLFLIDPDVRALSPGLAAGIGIGSLVLGWFVYDALCRSAMASREFALAGTGFVFIVAVAFGFQTVFSGRGALMHTGALMGTIMAANVLLVIIPNQKKVIADLVAGREPDPKLGRIGKTRSTHNNYLTLPVLFLMLSPHYPMTFASEYAFVIVALVLVAGASIRHFYNRRHAGEGNPWWAWAVAGAAIAVAVAITIMARPTWLAGSAPVSVTKAADVPRAVDEILSSRCVMCHADEPVWAGIAIAPKGVRLDTPDLIARQRESIRMQTVLSKAMPPNNITGMTREERRVLAQWLSQP